MNKVSIFDLVEYFPNLSQGQAALIDQVCNLMWLIIVMPATNATSERSFSTKESKELFEINNPSREAKLSDASPCS